VKLVRCRRPKAACSLSYVDYRPNTNAAILWDADYTKYRAHSGGTEQGKEIKNLNVVDVLSYSNEYRNLKLTGATMGRGLGRSEED
jgi:hypothetical protein